MCAARLAEEKEGKYSEGGYKRLINFPGERENTFLPMKE
jgi:hypothetical protein